MSDTKLDALAQAVTEMADRVRQDVDAGITGADYWPSLGEYNLAVRAHERAACRDAVRNAPRFDPDERAEGGVCMVEYDLGNWFHESDVLTAIDARGTP